MTTLLLIVGMFAVFANRLLFNADNWSNTSTQLLQNAAIRSTTANYLVDQLYANYNVAGLIKSGLPKQLQPLSGPAAGALRNVAVAGTDLALSRPRVQNLWMQANRLADQTFIATRRRREGERKLNQGAVTLNLGGILDTIAGRLGLPSGITSKLPPNIANLTVLKSRQLKTVQDGGKAVKGLALLLTILCPCSTRLRFFLLPAAPANAHDDRVRRRLCRSARTGGTPDYRGPDTRVAHDRCIAAGNDPCRGSHRNGAADGRGQRCGVHRGGA